MSETGGIYTIEDVAHAERRRAVVRVDADYLIEMLGLPARTRVIGMQMNLNGDLEICVEHVSLPAVLPESMAPRVSVVMTMQTLRPSEFAAADVAGIGLISAAWSDAPEEKWPTMLARVFKSGTTP